MSDIVSYTVPVTSDGTTTDTTLYFKDGDLREDVEKVKEYIGYVPPKVIGLQADFDQFPMSSYTVDGNIYTIRYVQGRADINDIKAYIGYPDEADIVGLCADFENSEFTRLAAATGKSAGSDFDIFPMFGGRRLCNLADDGTVNAWYGEPGYVEDGSNGQVMVWQPKFYYRVLPIKMEKIAPEVIDPTADPPVYTQPEGYHLLKVNYYVSSKAYPGFKCHPAFFDGDGNEVDGIYISAYEGSIYDVSESKYLLYDDCDFVDGVYTANVYLAEPIEDKFCSVAGVKPASGLNNNLTRPNVELMCRNRGTRWHTENLQVTSMEQLLMVIEYATFNMQNAIGNGITNRASGTGNEAASTGSTAFLGNASGVATTTRRILSDGTIIDGTTANERSVKYRGRENSWANIWAFVNGLNIWGDGNKRGGVPYYAKDFSYAESKKDGNYKSAGITVASALDLSYTYGYINRFGWSEECDWAFLPTDLDHGANSTSPVGDYTYIAKNLNAYRIAYLGGSWTYGGTAGPFSLALHAGVGYRHQIIGARLFLV